MDLDGHVPSHRLGLRLEFQAKFRLFALLQLPALTVLLQKEGAFYAGCT